MNGFVQHCVRYFTGRCDFCGRLHWRCECGVIIAAIVVALAAAYSAYSANQAQQRAAKAAKYQAQQEADAEQMAGEARAKQIQYEADKVRKSLASREAGAGVQIGQGSLLEDEGQFAFDTEYSKELAKYPHELAGASDKYKSDLFGFQEKTLKNSLWSDTIVAGVSSGAGTYSSLAGGKSSTKPSSVDV